MIAKAMHAWGPMGRCDVNSNWLVLKTPSSIRLQNFEAEDISIAITMHLLKLRAIQSPSTLAMDVPGILDIKAYLSGALYTKQK